MSDISISKVDSHLDKCNRVKRTTRLSLLRSIVFFSIIPIVLLSIVYYSITINQVIKKNTDDMQIVVSNISETISDLFEDRTSLLLGLGHEAEKAENPQDLKAYLHMLAAAHPDIESMSITDADGVQLVRSDDNPLLDISDRGFFKDLMAGSDLAISNTLISRTSENPILVIAAGVKDEQGKTKGVANLLISLDKLYNRLEEYDFGQETSLYIVDGTGKIALHPKKEMIEMSEPATDWEPVAKVLEDKEAGALVYRNPVDKKKYLSSYSFIDQVQWSIIIEQSYGSLMRQTLILLSDSLVITAVFIIGLTVTGGIIYRRLRKEIILTRREGQKIARALAEEHEKSFFYANIAHELRTPINAVLCSIQLLELERNRDFGCFKAHEKTLAIMKQNCMRLLRLVNNYIDITKIDTGFQKLQLKNVDIVPLVEEIVMSVSDYAKQKGIQLIFDTNVEEQAVACDPEKIERIVLNLLSNAVKFTPRDGRIEVNLLVEEGFLNLSIEDTGTGIKAENLDKVFNRFWQEKNPEYSYYEGSGIGLALARSFVKLHDGDIKIESEENLGTKVSFNIPIKQIDDEDGIDIVSQDNLQDKIRVELSSLD